MTRKRGASRGRRKNLSSTSKHLSSSSAANLNSSQLRILSVNACCLPSGYRNAKLPTDTVRAGFGLHFLIYGLILVYYHHYYEPISIDLWMDSNFLAVAIPLFTVCFLPGWLLGGQAARIVGCFRQQFCGWGSDYKYTRLQVLAEDILSQYDVVAIQELFGSIPSVMDAGHVDCLIGYAARQGLVHVARPAATKWPSLAMDSGLLILSRFPIEESTPLVFSHQFVGEQFAVNRGAMHARIRLPQRYDGFTQGQCLDFFTAHVSPSMRKLLEGFPEHLLSLGDNARLSQFSELGTFIASKRELGTRCIVAGDFNADILFPRSTKTNKRMKPVAGDAMKVVLMTMADQLHLFDTTNGKYTPTFGYDGKERLLTNTRQRNALVAKTDDLIFADAGVRWQHDGHFDWSTVSLEVKTERRQNTPFTHLSDHWGVSLLCPSVVWKVGGK